MTDVEDLLARTLRDPDRALPAPADPMPAIRARVRRQRRTTVLAAAAVVLVVAAALAVPSTITRLTRPLPVATDPPPASSGLLPWAARGPLTGDTGLVADAARVWRDAGGPADARLLWAGPVDTARVVLLQGTGRDGGARIAEVGDRDGRLAVLRTEPIREPDIQLARLVDPRPGADRTLLLPRPGAATARVLAGAGAASEEPVPPGGLVTVEGEAQGRSVALLDRDGRVLGDDLVAPTGTLLPVRQDVRLAAPTWETSDGVRAPQAEDYLGGQVLGGQLPASPLRQPVSVGVLDDSSTVDLRRAGTVRPVLYELRQAGRTYVGWIVWVRDRPECGQVQDITDAGQPDAVVVRCALGGDGLYSVALHEGIRLAGLRLDPAGPGQQAEDSEYAPALEGGLIGVKSPLPTGPGQVRLVDDAGRPRPPISLPPYRP